jgi:hypothetical protein
MNWHKLGKLALYVLEALLWVGVLWTGVAILGGMIYLREASKIDYADMWSEIFSILKNEIILATVGTLFLFGIGTLRTYMKRNREAEIRNS